MKQQSNFAQIFNIPHAFQNIPEQFGQHFLHLSLQIKAAFNLSTTLIAAFNVISSQNVNLQLQNTILNSQLKEVLTRINFVKNQNSRSGSNINQILEKSFLLTEKIQKQDLEIQKQKQDTEEFQKQMQHRTASIQQTAASIRLNIKHPQTQPKSFTQALKSGIIPSQLLAQTLASPSDSSVLQSNTPKTATTNKLNLTTETNFALKIQTTSNFQSAQEFMNKHLRILQIKHKLPKISSIFGEKNSLNEFRLRFNSPDDRELWYSFFTTIPEIVSCSNRLNLNSTKIRMKGIPTALVQKGPTHLSKVLCDYFKLQQSELKQIFQFEEKLSPGFSIVAFAISPNARRIFHSQGDSFYLDQLDFAVTIEDFLQPLQCSRCLQFGHPSKRCNNLKICTNCSKHSCPSNNTDSSQTCCHDLYCINCGLNDHSPNQREKCPAYQAIFDVAFKNLTNILSEDRSPDPTTSIPPACSEDHSATNV
jgi:hypothetical protein